MTNSNRCLKKSVVNLKKIVCLDEVVLIIILEANWIKWNIFSRKVKFFNKCFMSGTHENTDHKHNKHLHGHKIKRLLWEEIEPMTDSATGTYYDQITGLFVVYVLSIN